MKKTPDPEWYVYVEDTNNKSIKKFNVFHSLNFMTGCRKTFKKYKDLADIEKEIKSWAMYSFCSKCEYEVVVTGWIRDEIKRKIDVYDQLMLNWDSFFEYLIKHKAVFRRKI